MNVLGVTLDPNNVVPQLSFLAFAAVAIFASIMMVTRTNPVHSAVWLVLVFFQIAGIYVLLNAPFLAALQVLVYAGAILVLFLFVIMLLQMREGPQLASQHPVQRIISWPVGILLAIEMCAIIILSSTLSAPPITAAANVSNPGGAAPSVSGAATGAWTPSTIAAWGGEPRVLGINLYTDFLLPFEIASLILLVAVVGAILLAGRTEPQGALRDVPTVGITLGRRSIFGSPQEQQFDREVRPDILGQGNGGQPTSNGAGIPEAQEPVRGEVVKR